MAFPPDYNDRSGFNEALHLTKESTVLAIPGEINGVPVTSIERSGWINRLVAGDQSLDFSAGEMADGITEIHIPANVTNVDVLVFNDFEKLMSIRVHPDNRFFCSKEGVLLDKSATALLRMPPGIAGAVSIPDDVTTIGESAFEACNGFTHLTIPDHVKSISYSAFMGCRSLRQIEIPDGVQEIKASAFDGCSNLDRVVIPANVTTLEDGVFNGCCSLTGIEIPSSITNIEYGVFYGCHALTSVCFKGDAPVFGIHVFEGAESTVLYCEPDAKGWPESIEGCPVVRKGIP